MTRAADALRDRMAKPSKYRAQKVQVCAKCWGPYEIQCGCSAGSATFDSKGELRRWHELLLLEKAGEIRRLERQPEFAFNEGDKAIFKYRADFAYFEGQTRIIEDFKGFKTREYKLKKKLVEARFHISIRETA